MQTPEQQGFYGNIRQQSGVECWQMKKTPPPYAKCCQLVTLLMRLKEMLKAMVVSPQPWPCSEAQSKHVGSQTQTPYPARPLPWGQALFLISKTLQMLAWGLIYIFFKSCAGCPPLLTPLGQHRQCCSPGEGLASVSPSGVNWACHHLEHPQQMSYFTSTHLFLFGNEATSFPRVAQTVHSI